MADLWHTMGNDLVLDATGDLLTASGSDETQQRVLRRLMTNPGALVYHTAYGAGLARFVGQPAPAARIAAIARRQMALERGIGRTPAPVADVTADLAGKVTLTVRYADIATGLPSTIPIPVA